VKLWAHVKSSVILVEEATGLDVGGDPERPNLQWMSLVTWRARPPKRYSLLLLLGSINYSILLLGWRGAGNICHCLLTGRMLYSRSGKERCFRKKELGGCLGRSMMWACHRLLSSFPVEHGGTQNAHCLVVRTSVRSLMVDVTLLWLTSSQRLQRATSHMIPCTD